MPPPLSQQPGSRAGLVSALVIAIIFLLISLLCNFYFQSQETAAEDHYRQLKNKYAMMVPPEATDSTATYRELHPAGLRDGMTWLDRSVAQTVSVNKLITGSTDSPVNVADTDKAVDDLRANAQSALAQSGVKVTVTGESLKTVIENLSKALIEQHDAAQKALADYNTALKQQTEAQANQKQELDTRQQAVLKANEDASKADAAKNAAVDRSNAEVAAAAAREKQTVDNSNKAIQEKEVQIAQQRQNLLKIDQELNTLRAQLQKWRLRPSDPILRQADARIIRIGTANDVFIDLGTDDHVPPGLTFEVYDKNEGVPKLGEGLSPDNLPQGKASIEVIDVGQNACRCRIIKTYPGQTLSEGDICVNLIYDRHVKLKFFVYGDFDMKGDGVYTAAGAEMVKNLITRWGGTVVNKLSVDTDFVILGREPEVPTLTKEQDADPILHNKLLTAKDALDKYTEKINQASTYNISIMNQTRFLYYTGYFDLLKR